MALSKAGITAPPKGAYSCAVCGLTHCMRHVRICVEQTKGYNINEVSIGDDSVKPKSSIDILLKRSRPFVDYLMNDLDNFSLKSFEIVDIRGGRIALRCLVDFPSGHMITVNTPMAQKGKWNPVDPNVTIDPSEYPLWDSPENKLQELTQLNWDPNRVYALLERIGPTFSKKKKETEQAIEEQIKKYITKHSAKLKVQADEISMEYLRRTFFRVMKPFTDVPEETIALLLSEFYCKNVQDS